MSHFHLSKDRMADELNTIMNASRGIRKVFLNVPLKNYIHWLQAEEAVIQEWNRDEVEKRPGDASQLLHSMAMGWSVGIFLGNWNGILPANGIPNFSRENPLKTTEGGHRSRWIMEIAKGDATIGGHNLARIQTLNPELAEKIMNYKLRIEVTTHESGVVPDSYTKGEYTAINTLSCGLTTGETLLASVNENFNMLHETLMDVFKNREKKMEGMAREKDAELLAAHIQIIHGVLEDKGDPLKPTKEELLALAPSDTIMEEALRVINCIGDLENWLKVNYNDKKFSKKALEEAPKLDFFGPLLYGLTKAGADRATAMANIKKFYQMSMVDGDTWKVNSGKIRNLDKKSGNGGGRYNRKRYESGWNQLLSIIGPSVSMTGPAGVTVEE
jgi:hypothetical protein